jgi:transcriptional regulator with XRE-family HTH domain
VAEKNVLLQKLGKRITSERESKGITMEKLAYEMDISKGNLSEIERGLRDARFSTIYAIAEGLEINISKLLKDL